MGSESLFALIVTVVALFFTGMAAIAAKDQTNIQRQLRKDAAQPYVWADVEPDSGQGTLIRLVVGNAEPTMATNVRVTFDPPLPVGEKFPGRSIEGQRRLAEGIRSLAPGRQLRWSAGAGYEVIVDSPKVIHKVTVTADGPFGPVEPLIYDLDLQDMRDVLDQPDGNLHILTKAVEKLTAKYVPAK